MEIYPWPDHILALAKGHRSDCPCPDQLYDALTEAGYLNAASHFRPGSACRKDSGCIAVEIILGGGHPKHIFLK